MPVSVTVGAGGSGSSSYGTGQSTSSPVAFPGALGLYNDLLNRNQQNYNTMLGLYGPAQQTTNSAVNAANTAVSDAGLFPALGGRAINRTFQQANANTELGLINSGLGLNSSELSQFDVQNTLNAGYAYGALTKGLAGQQAQVGLQGAGLQQQLATNEAGNLAGYRFANTFGNLFGQQSQATNNQAAVSRSQQFSPGQIAGANAAAAGPRIGGLNNNSPYNPAQQAQADLARAQAAAIRAGTAGGGTGGNPAVPGFSSQQLAGNPYSGGSNPSSWLNSILGGGGGPYNPYGATQGLPGGTVEGGDEGTGEGGLSQAEIEAQAAAEGSVAPTAGTPGIDTPISTPYNYGAMQELYGGSFNYGSSFYY